MSYLINHYYSKQLKIQATFITTCVCIILTGFNTISVSAQTGDLGRNFIKFNLGVSSMDWSSRLDSPAGGAFFDFSGSEDAVSTGTTINYSFNTEPASFSFDIRFDYNYVEFDALSKEHRFLLSCYYWDDTFQYFRPFIRADIFHRYSDSYAFDNHDNILQIGVGSETVWMDGLSSRIFILRDSEDATTYGLGTTFWGSSRVGFGLDMTYTKDSFKSSNLTDSGWRFVNSDSTQFYSSVGISF